MTLRRFLNVAYAILVEEYQRLGIDLVTALEKIEGLAESTPPAEGPRPQPKTVIASNQASMQALQGMLAGVQGAPGRGK